MTAPPFSVLVVDDDPDDLLDITAALQQADPTLYTVVAYNGVEALDYLLKAKASGSLPRFITLDINMPRMDGKQTVAALKADPQLAAIPVVVFTTSSSEVDRTFCTCYGVQMVTKPHGHKDIIRVVQQIFSAVTTR